MILFTTQNFLPDMGGMQMYVTGLADTLSSHGHAVVVYCDSETGSASADNTRNYAINRFGGPKPWIRWRKARAAARRIRAGGVTAVLADSWKSLDHLPARALATTHVVCLAHGAEFLVRPGSAKERRMIRSLAKADIVAANSHFTADLVRPLLRKDADLRVLMPGVYPPAGAPRTYVRRPRRRNILTIARFDPYKGIDTIMRTVAGLKRKYPDLVYHVVGDGKDRARLESLVASLGVSDCVRLHGRVSDSEKAALLSQCDIFALANRREPGEVEGFGIVFVEAGAYGLPVIAGADGGTADAVVDGETGLLVDAANDVAVRDALVRLLESPADAERMGEAGHARFWSEFSWDAAIARFETLLDRPA
jgi:phosphatidylinositol alpha-1,6-mannosyltransferase